VLTKAMASASLSRKAEEGVSHAGRNRHR